MPFPKTVYVAPVIELPKPIEDLLPWQQQAARMRLAGIGRREIALELEKPLSSVSRLFSEKVRASWKARDAGHKRAYRERIRAGLVFPARPAAGCYSPFKS